MFSQFNYYAKKKSNLWQCSFITLCFLTLFLFILEMGMGRSIPVKNVRVKVISFTMPQPFPCTLSVKYINRCVLYFLLYCHTSYRIKFHIEREKGKKSCSRKIGSKHPLKKLRIRVQPLEKIGSGSSTLQDILVPEYGVVGKHAVLSCVYFPTNQIYSVTWYKNGLEFFR